MATSAGVTAVSMGLVGKRLDAEIRRRRDAQRELHQLDAIDGGRLADDGGQAQAGDEVMR